MGPAFIVHVEYTDANRSSAPVSDIPQLVIYLAGLLHKKTWNVIRIERNRNVL
jgi:hypothetical protein